MLPTVILPGYLASAAEYIGLKQQLQKRNIPTEIVPLTKWDWVPTLGGRSVMPIIYKIDQTVQQMRIEYQSEKVNLVGHSAGGWIARIYLGEIPYDIHGDAIPLEWWNKSSHISTLVTLGTPHTSEERWTKRNLNFVNLHYPGAFYPKIKYVCVAGKAIFGQRKLGSWLAYNSYKLTCGEGNCWGDGITPIQAAHLNQAVNLTFEGVKHSPAASSWYGSPKVVEDWVIYLLE